mgnify:CR=1 FL=1
MDKDVVLSNGAGELQVRVGDGARGILAADNLPLYGCGKGHSPEEGVQFASSLRLDEDYSAHAGCRGIRGSDGGNGHVNYFSKTRGTVVQVVHYPPDVVEEVMHVGSEADSLPRLMPEGFLQEAEQASQARHCKDHTVELTKNMLPALGDNTGLAGRKFL